VIGACAPIHPRVGPAVRPDVRIRAGLLFSLRNFRFSAADLQEDLQPRFRAAMTARLAERRYRQALSFEDTNRDLVGTKAS
jgi:hypothetical protein